MREQTMQEWKKAFPEKTTPKQPNGAEDVFQMAVDLGYNEVAEAIDPKRHLQMKPTNLANDFHKRLIPDECWGCEEPIPHEFVEVLLYKSYGDTNHNRVMHRFCTNCAKKFGITNEELLQAARIQ